MANFERYGGLRGYLSHIQSRAVHALGGYGDAADVDWSLVRRLVFVCKGNICRSPYASAKARSLGLEAASFGLDTAGGAPADPVAARNAALRGLDLSAHRSAQLEEAHIKGDDLVVAFEPGQVAAVRQRCPGRACAVSLMGIWASPFRPHLQDPYGQRDAYFQECFGIIDANVMELSRHLRRRRGEPTKARVD